jgi:hypothetical protein
MLTSDRIATPESVSGRAPRLDEVADLLSWSDCGDLLGRWASHRDRMLQERIDALAGNQTAFRPVQSVLAALPREVSRTFVRAPNVAAGLLGPLADDGVAVAAQIGEWLIAEIAPLGGGGTGPERPVWTARGVRTAAARDGLAAAPVPGGQLDECGIVCDEASPVRWPTIERGGNTLVPMAPDHVQATRAKLEAALAAMGSAVPPARELVRTVVEVVAIREDLDYPDKFGSSSFQDYIGLVLLTNPHLKHVHVALVAEALVHEAIHSLLGLWEAEAPFVLGAAARHERVTSPWTGASLRLPSYVHACLVWYGLLRFWRHAAAGEEFGAEVCAVRAARAQSGFLGAAASGGLAGKEAAVTPDILRLLIECESRALSLQ